MEGGWAGNGGNLVKAVYFISKGYLRLSGDNIFIIIMMAKSICQIINIFNMTR